MKKSPVIWRVFLPGNREIWRTEKSLMRRGPGGRIYGERRGPHSVWDDFRWAMTQ
jgi:hypothetical protein